MSANTLSELLIYQIYTITTAILSINQSISHQPVPSTCSGLPKLEHCNAMPLHFQKPDDQLDTKLLTSQSVVQTC